MFSPTVPSLREHSRRSPTVTKPAVFAGTPGTPSVLIFTGTPGTAGAVRGRRSGGGGRSARRHGWSWRSGGRGWGFVQGRGYLFRGCGDVFRGGREGVEIDMFSLTEPSLREHSRRSPTVTSPAVPVFAEGRGSVLMFTGTPGTPAARAVRGRRWRSRGGGRYGRSRSARPVHSFGGGIFVGKGMLREISVVCGNRSRILRRRSGRDGGLGSRDLKREGTR